jgi:hypothetical protein
MTRCLWWAEVEAAVGPVTVVVGDVGSQDGFEMASPEDEDPVEAFASDGADPAFGVGVGLGGADGGPDRGDVFGAKDVVEGTGEVGVSVSDQETAPSQVFSGPYREVAGLLGDPDAGRVRRDSGEVDPVGAGNSVTSLTCEFGWCPSTDWALCKPVALRELKRSRCSRGQCCHGRNREVG